MIGDRMWRMADDHAHIRAIALLHEPVRRALYEWVVAAARPVSRDEAAANVGVTRSLAAFHLDRLADAGLLATEYRRLSGRTGPGAGRPAKLYRRGEQEVAVSLPGRRYEFAARLLAASIERSDGRMPRAALREVAHERGRGLGEAARGGMRRKLGRLRARASVMAALRDQGFAPFEAEDGTIRQGSCPFHALVGEHRELICGMNLALTEGILEGVGSNRLGARLEPRPGTCCVVIEDTEPAAR